MLRLLCFYAFLVYLAGCSSPAPAPARQTNSPAATPAQPSQAKADSPAPDERSLLICFGDSLTAGYGVGPDEGFPVLLQQEFNAKKTPWRVVNAGLSGDTTSGGLDRLPQVIALKPAAVLLELGANDGLRGIPISVTRANLEQMILALKGTGTTVVLAGMTLPRNYGEAFIKQFEALYADLARKHRLTLLRFELEPLAAKGLLQADGLHPTAEGYRVALPRLLAGLAPALRK